MSDQAVTRPPPTHKHRLNTEHPCLEWDPNPRSQCSSYEDVSCLKLRPHRALRTELCVASHIVNKRRYFSVRVANIVYVACVAYVALCVAAALDRSATVIGRFS
jgi:hypothetical protein